MAELTHTPMADPPRKRFGTKLTLTRTPIREVSDETLAKLQVSAGLPPCTCGCTSAETCGCPP